MASEWERRNELVKEKDKKKITKEGIREVLELYRYMLPYKWYFAGGMLTLSFSALTSLSFPKFFGGMANAATGKISDFFVYLKPIETYFGVETLNALAIVMGIVLLVQGILSFGRVYFFSQVSEKTMADIRYSVYRKIITMPVTFFEQRRVGELNSRLASDVTQLQDVLSVTLAELFRQLLTLIIGVSVLLYWSPRLTFSMLATFPVLIIITMVFGRFIRKISKKAQDELANATVVVEETLQSVNIVKAFTNELKEVNRYRNALDNNVKMSLKAARWRGLFVMFVIYAIFGAIILIVWNAAGMVKQNQIGIGDLIEFISYTVFIGASVGSLGDIYSQLQKTIGASERIREILRETPEFDLPQKQTLFPRLSGDVQFKDVHFAYPSRLDTPVLKGLSLSIGKGEKVALVGQSGAGKSTIAQLIMRFYPHSEGEILFDNQPIRSFDIQQLRQNIGIVPQEIILFGGTIRENISYGKPSATEAEIQEAAQRANALEFIERFPEGMDTIVGERGIKLSGGQRQRIAIARAILKNPALLILDEATSSLDAESESLVQGALNELMKNRTTLIIAHRLSTIRTADNIYVLDGGRVAESGTHDQLLLNPSGIYSNLVRLQSEGIIGV
ncbi:MAG: ATP-binding cassette domain-containing protein [Bacteroidia bacterium]|nr:ATP-binding cassette domain-containing protein [Bacteroidia bacterium]